jgi:LDH2 family malate/lactate/ureidoglycolate dehydrogenase
MMAGSAIAPPWLTDMGLFMFVVDPSVLSESFPIRTSEFVEMLHATRPIDADQRVRVPFERSIALRNTMRAAGEFEVEDQHVEALREVLARRSR